MAKQKQFMAVHRNPGLDCATVQGNWRKLANVESATWVRTYFNEPTGTRYCVWLAPDEKELKRIFEEMGVGYESVLPVQETIPDLWGEAWQEHVRTDAAADNLGN